MLKSFETFCVRGLWVSLLVTLLSSVAMASADDRTRVLVTEIGGLGLSSTDRIEITKLVRKRVAEFGKIEVRFLSKIDESCLKQTACLQKLGTDQAAHFLLEGKANALGSTFTVKLNLHDLKNPQQKPLSIRETGKRATITFDEAAQNAVRALLEQAGIQQKGRLMVAGVPRGAQIKINNKTILQSAEKPDLAFKMNPGEHTVTVSMVGFDDLSQLVTIKPGETEHVAVKLAKTKPKTDPVADTSFTALQPMKKVSQTRGEEEHRKSWYEKWWVWGIVGGVVASAATVAVIGMSGGGPDAPGSTNGGSTSGSTNPPGGGGGGGNTGPFTIDAPVSLVGAK